MPVRTMTATIASEMGEVASGSPHYHVLFFIGIILFLISLAVNLAATSIACAQAQTAGKAAVMMQKQLPSRKLSARRSPTAGLCRVALVAVLTVTPIVAVVIYILSLGLPAITWEFLTAMPSNGMRAGGFSQRSSALFTSPWAPRSSLCPSVLRRRFTCPNMPATPA